jgi:hypothetical protein
MLGSHILKPKFAEENMFSGAKNGQKKPENVGQTQKSRSKIWNDSKKKTAFVQNSPVISIFSPGLQPIELVKSKYFDQKYFSKNETGLGSEGEINFRWSSFLAFETPEYDAILLNFLILKTK